MTRKISRAIEELGGSLCGAWKYTLYSRNNRRGRAGKRISKKIGDLCSRELCEDLVLYIQNSFNRENSLVQSVDGCSRVNLLNIG